MTRCPTCGRAYGPVSRPVRLACKAAVEGTDVKWQKLLGKNRHKRVVHARWRAFLILRKEGWSFPEIGLEFGKDHSTVQYGLEKQAQLEADK